jgi:tetratricopeptide (TPR) repeat protein
MSIDRGATGEEDAPGRHDADDTLTVVTAAAPLPTRGTILGRYTIVDRIGSGGMGTVFSAHDPELDRRIALKVLRTPAADPMARGELLREAQALAMLSHPNVVPIYDVGIADGVVWLAMAEVRGGSLARWLGPARDWREIVTMFVGAGRGLAAAHDAGLVHGDFKPTNVLVDDRGQACVVDFGLARRSSSVPSVDRVVPDAVPLGDESTRDGIVRGTPAYMAPEQMCGQPLDARTDQFAFCVALFNALYGIHPFIEDRERDVAATVGPLLKRIDEGRIAARPPGRMIPRSIDRVLVRGMASKPAQRWSSMEVLVLKLERALTSPSAAVLPLAIGALVVVGGAAFVADRSPTRCEGAGDLDEIWNPDRATAVTTHLASFDVAFADDTAAMVGHDLSAWATSWQARHAELCVAPDPAAMRCLVEARVGFATTVALLERADNKGLARASAAVHALPSPQACGRGGEGAATDAPALVALHAQLAEVEALEAAGRFDAAVASARAAVVVADSLGEPIAAARANRVLGSVLDSTGEYAEAERALERARWIAVEIGRDDLAVAAMASLLKIVGHDLARFDDARAIERHAEAALARFTVEPRTLASLRNAQGLLHLAAGEPDAAIGRFADAVDLVARTPDGEHRLQAPLNNYANALAAAGRYAEARAALERARAIVERSLGPDHPSQVGYASNLGFIADRQGETADARRYLESAVSLGEQVLGADHPGVYEARNNLAVFHFARGDLDIAEALFERALSAARKHLGPDHPSLGRVIGNLALCESERGNPEGALVRYDEALALAERSLDADHTDIALTLNNRGSALRRLGRLAEARESYERALEIRLAKLGKDHPDVATTLDNLGLLALAEGNPNAALELHQQAYDVWMRAHGERHSRIAGVLGDLATDHIALGQRDEARGLLERAEAIWQSLDDIDESDAAQSRLALAELLDDDPPRARGLAREALAGFESRPARWRDEITRAQALLLRIGG